MNLAIATPEIEAPDHVYVDETNNRATRLKPTPAPKRILVVDDDALVRSALSAVLDCEGYEAHGACDGHAAIKSALEHQPDLVLLDLNMPNLDGWSAFVKLDHIRPLIPIIVITARPHQYEHAVKLGVDAFMEKPLDFPVLLRAIHKLTSEAEERHIKRITNPGFVTRRLDRHSPTHS